MHSSRYRGTNHNIGFITVATQQHTKCGFKVHKQRHTFTLTRLRERLTQLLTETLLMMPALITHPTRARLIQR